MNVKSITKNSKLGMYIPVPIPLLASEFSSTTLLIYGSLLNRALLSQRNGWHNQSGEVFVRFTIEELAKYVGRGISTVKASLKELEEAGLIRRQRMDLYTTIIFVNVPENCLIGQNLGLSEPKSRPFKVQQSGLQIAGKLTTNNNIKEHNLVTEKYTCEEGESL